MAKNPFNGEVLHCVGVRLRITGIGNLHVQLQSLEAQQTSDLADVAMMTSTSREPTQLANFSSQRMRVKISTTAINEYFNLSKLVLFIRPISSGYPQ